MSRITSLLELPAELKTMIYSHYLTTKEGYLFNIESGKLVAADGQPIDFSLMYTCTQIAREMQGLALKHNSITFAETYFKKLSALALNHQRLLSDLYICQWEMFLKVGPCINDDIRQKIAQEFPDFGPALEYVADLDYDDEVGDFYTAQGLRDCLANCGQSYFGSSRFIARVLDLASNLPEFVDTGKPWCNKFKPLKILDWSHLTTAPWVIPSMKTLSQIPQALWGDPLERDTRSKKCRFSTAAVAIKFLSSLPLVKRLQIRKIALREDNRTGGYSEYHPHGLIPFCQENPRLRIEYRRNVWANILKPGGGWPYRYWGEPTKVTGRSAWGSLTTYILETIALTRAGMPPGSFTLILDGNPALEDCTKLFEITLIRGVARRTILEKLCSAANPSRKADRYQQVLSQAIKDLINGDSIIHCNFPAGQMLDTEELMRTHPSWTINQWQWKNFLRPEIQIADWKVAQQQWADLFPECLYVPY